MESVNPYYEGESYFSPSDKYLEPQAWLNCDEQQRLFRYRGSEKKRGLSYANRSTPVHDLTQLPCTPDRQVDLQARKNRVNADVFYGDGTYFIPESRMSPEWTCRRQADPNRVYHGNVSYNGNQPLSPRTVKSKDRAEKGVDHYEYSPMRNGKPEMLDYGAFVVDERRQDFRYRHDMPADIIKTPRNSSVPPVYYYDVYRDAVPFPPSGHSNMWQPWPDVSRPLDRTAAMSPSSPLDSGLSSQSVASTPNSELEPLSNWDQTYSGNCDWVQMSYPENYDAKQCSCPSEMYAVSPQTTTHHDRNPRQNPSRTISHPLSHSCQSNLPSLSNRGMHQHSSFGEISVDRNTEVNCKCHSSVESVSDSYELRNVTWTLHPETQTDSSNRYFVERVDRKAVHQSSASDGTSDSTLKESSVKYNFIPVERKARDESADGPNETKGEHLLPKIDSEFSSKDAELLHQKQRIKNAKKAEKALCELEEIYNQLNLDDFDLLDRAERRDLPTAHQMMAEDSYKSQPLTRSKSDTFYEIYGREYGIGYSQSPRAPPLRRAGIPDRIADDMALRKQQKPATKLRKSICSPSSYLLYSSHFTPSIPPVVKDFPFVNKPDVEYDDLSYRKYFHPKAYHELPQPPFGIPLHPMIQCPESSYLHATPSSVPRALCHARGNPDLVRDDMAYRNLRKDNPLRCAPDELPLPGR